MGFSTISSLCMRLTTVGAAWLPLESPKTASNSSTNDSFRVSSLELTLID